MNNDDALIYCISANKVAENSEDFYKFIDFEKFLGIFDKNIAKHGFMCYTFIAPRI
jgi:hypothetical protein